MDQQNKSSTKRFLVIYCVAIFFFAAALILIASYSQMRSSAEADRIQSELTAAEILAADKQTRLDAVMTENTRLNSRIEQLQTSNETLTQKNEELTTQKTELENKLSASRKLAKMVNYKRLGKTKSLRTLRTEFKNAGLEAFLSEEELEIYNSIK